MVSSRQDTPDHVPDALLPAVLAIVTSLALDFFHYLVGATLWGIYVRRLERKTVVPTPPVQPPLWMERVTDGFFYGKTLAILTAYVYIAVFVVQTLI